MSHTAYKRAQALDVRPRANEERLMTQITSELLKVQHGSLTPAAMMPALHRNREVWTVLSAACGSAGNGLPHELRASIVSLALWVDRFTSEVVRGRESIDALIDVNSSIIDGLSSKGVVTTT